MRRSNVSAFCFKYPIADADPATVLGCRSWVVGWGVWDVLRWWRGRDGGAVGKGDRGQGARGLWGPGGCGGQGAMGARWGPGGQEPGGQGPRGQGARGQEARSQGAREPQKIHRGSITCITVGIQKYSFPVEHFLGPQNADTAWDCIQKGSKNCNFRPSKHRYCMGLAPEVVEK